MTFPRWVLVAAYLVVVGGCHGSSGTPTGSDSVVAEPVDGPVIYVSVDGDDRHNGRSPESALGTIQKAVENASSGFAILVAPSVYRQTVQIENVTGPLRIEGRGGVILDGQRERRVGILIVDSDRVVLDNLEIRNYTDVGAAVYDSSQIVLSSLVVHDNGFLSQGPEFDGEGFGIDIEESRDVTVEDSEAFANGPNPSVRARGVFGTGINTYGNRDIMVRRNFCHHNIGGGLLIEDSFGVVVEDNRIEGNDLDASEFNYWDGGLWLDGGGDVVVRNNSFHGNLGPGIQISDEDDQGPRGYLFQGNVSSGNYFGLFIWNFGVCPFPPQDVLQLEENDFSGNSRQDVWCEER